MVRTLSIETYLSRQLAFSLEDFFLSELNFPKHHPDVGK